MRLCFLLFHSFIRFHRWLKYLALTAQYHAWVLFGSNSLFSVSFGCFCIAHFMFDRLTLTHRRNPFADMSLPTQSHIHHIEFLFAEQSNQEQKCERERRPANDWYIFPIFLAWRRVTALIHDKCCPFHFNTCALSIGCDTRYRSSAKACQCKRIFHSRLFTKGR